jgi:hypothetical protein
MMDVKRRLTLAVIIRLVSEGGAGRGSRTISVINCLFIMDCGDPLAYINSVR